MDLEQKISVLMQRNAVLEKRSRWQDQECERLRNRVKELETSSPIADVADDAEAPPRLKGDSFGLDPTQLVQDFLREYVSNPREAASMLHKKLQSIQVRASQFTKNYEDLNVRFRTVQQNYLGLRKSMKATVQDAYKAQKPLVDGQAPASTTKEKVPQMSYRNLGQSTVEQPLKSEPRHGSMIHPGNRRTKRFGSAGRRRSLPVVPSAKQIGGYFNVPQTINESRAEQKGQDRDTIKLPSPRKKAPPRRRYSAGIVRSQVDPGTRSIYSPRTHSRAQQGYRPRDFEKAKNIPKLTRSNSDPGAEQSRRRKPKPEDFGGGGRDGHGRTISLSDIPADAVKGLMSQGRGLQRRDSHPREDDDLSDIEEQERTAQPKPTASRKEKADPQFQEFFNNLMAKNGLATGGQGSVEPPIYQDMHPSIDENLMEV